MFGKKISTVILTMCFIMISAVVAGASEAEQDTQENSNLKISEGVYVEDVNISGLTSEEAKALVEQYIGEFTSKEVTLKMDDNQAAMTIGELGYYWANTDILDEAMSLCKSGNIIKRFKDKEDVKEDSKVYTIDYEVNNEVLGNAINTHCGGFNVPHSNPSVVKEGSGFKVVGQETWGRIIDVDASIENIRNYLLNEWNKESTQIDLVVVDDAPSASAEDCARVKDLLGSFSTNFSTGSSNYNRNMNIKNGARLIDGSVVYPGETFSANAALNPFTAANGYYEAGTFENGRVVDSIGGGICQVSSTFYNAILLAELEVVQRANHSMTVGYVPLAADAALAGTWKDLKFKNNTDTPVYIEAIYTDGKITFNLYGEETRPANRSIKYESETISTTPYTEKITEDPTKPVGYRVVTESGHTGYVAKLWKYVYVNGTQQSVELVNTSTYQASQAMVTIGTGAAAEASQPETSQEETPAPDTDTGTEDPNSGGDAGDGTEAGEGQ